MTTSRSGDTPSNERLREMATSPIGDIQNLATELLAAREQQSAAQVQADALHALITSIIKRHNGPPAIFDFAAWVGGEIARAEKAEAERDREAREAAGYQKIAKQAADAEKPGLLVLLVDQNGAEVRIFGPDRDAEERFGETVARWWKLVQVVADDLLVKDAVAERDAARAEVERLRAELAKEAARGDDACLRIADLLNYRDRTEAALAELTSEFTKWQFAEADEIEGQESDVAADHNRMLERLKEIHSKAAVIGLVRDAKGAK